MGYGKLIGRFLGAVASAWPNPPWRSPAPSVILRGSFALDPNLVLGCAPAGPAPKPRRHSARPCEWLRAAVPGVGRP